MNENNTCIHKELCKMKYQVACENCSHYCYDKAFSRSYLRTLALNIAMRSCDGCLLFVDGKCSRLGENCMNALINHAIEHPTEE